MIPIRSPESDVVKDRGREKQLDEDGGWGRERDGA